MNCYSNQTFKMIMHLSGFFIFGYTILWQEINKNAPIYMLFNGKIHEQWKFGTQWNLHMHFIFYLISIYCDLNEKRNSKQNMEWCRKIGDLCFHSLIFPWSLHTFFIYWCGGTVERNIVSDLTYNEQSPQLLNHVVHTLVLPSVLIECYNNYHYRPSNKTCITLTYLVGILYTASFYYISITSNDWGYLIFKSSTLPVRLILSSLMALSVTFWYFFGGKCHRYLWNDRIFAANRKIKL